jgi:uncharacterized protein
MFLRVLAVALTFAASAFCPSAFAQTYPEPLGDTVSDFAEVLDATEEGRIVRLLEETRAATGVQMVVATLPGLGEAAPGIEAYAKGLFNAWGVGGAERNDGILLLIDTSGREARIALGSGYDAVYDGRAARVLSTALLPELRAGRMAAGIEAGVLSAKDRLIQPFLAGLPVTVDDGFEPAAGAGGTSPLTVAAGLAAFAGIAGFGFWRSRRAKRTCPNCGAPTLERSREVIDEPTKDSNGLGMQHLTCSACGFTDRKSYPISFSSREAREARSARSGGGKGGTSRGGFGGGRSSGGGASGKW